MRGGRRLTGDEKHDYEAFIAAENSHVPRMRGGGADLLNRRRVAPSPPPLLPSAILFTNSRHRS